MRALPTAALLGGWVPNALRRQIVRQFAMTLGGDANSALERVPLVTRIYDKLVERFQREGWPDDDGVIEAIRKEVEHYG